MIRVKGPNGVVVVVSESLAKSLVGDGNHGCHVVPNPRDVPEADKPPESPAPVPAPARKRTTAKRPPKAAN